MYTKWTYYSLSDNDPKAKKQVLKNLEIGACEHTLSKKLVARFSDASGPLLLIAFESLDLDAGCPHEYASYCGGNNKPPDSESISWMDCARWGLIPFVDKYLLKSKEAIVLCENWAATRKAVADCPRESRLLLFRDEVYHVLTNGNAGRPESIECAIRESQHHWATGVCSLCPEAPPLVITGGIFVVGGIMMLCGY